MSNYFVHKSACIDEGATIGRNSKIWHFSHIMSTARLGKNCILGQNVFIGSDVVLGDGVKVQNNVSLYSGVIAENDVFIGPSAVFTNIINPRSFIERKTEFKPTVLGKGCSIGANATIVCGNSIGSYALIGAGSVVTKHVLPHALMVGNPAKQIGWVSKLGHTLKFEGNIAVCPEDDSEYELVNDKLQEVSRG